jgi:transcriptional regulator with XRE-family HTH domain/tetratricopeptide (TPR) repeat protein
MISATVFAPRVRGSAMAMPQRLTFGELLKRYRAAAHLTQDELAERAGLSAKAISALERGERQAPRRETVALLAEALRLSESERAQFIAAARQRPTPPSQTSPVEQPALWPPLVGRDHEFARLEGHLTESASPVLLLSGEPGIGKTRLLQETRAWATAQGWTVLQGGCHRRSGQEPYAPFADLLSHFLAARSPAQRQLDLQGCAWVSRLLPELVESEVVPAPSWTLPPEQERRLMFGAVATLLKNVACPRGTLLLLDDLQWAASDALDLLAALVRGASAESVPLFRAIVAIRDTEVEPSGALGTLVTDLAREGRATRLTLRPLGEGDATELVEQLLPHEADQREDFVATRRQIVQRTGGVPFYLVSFAQELDTHAPADATDAERAPWTVLISVRQRVATLPDNAQQLLHVAAIAGRQTPRAILFSASSLSDQEALSALDSAVRARLLIDENNGVCSFPHDLIHEVIASDLTAGRRARLHLVVAEAMERLLTREQIAAELAWHFAEGGAAARALPYAHAAAVRADQARAHADAERFYRMAARLAQELGDQAQEAEALERLSLMFEQTGHRLDAIPLAERAVALRRVLGDHDQLAWATMLVAHGYIGAGRDKEGAAYLATFVASLTPEEPSLPIEPSEEEIIALLVPSRVQRALTPLSPRVAASLAARIASSLIQLWHPHDALEAIEQALRYAQASGDLPMLCSTHEEHGAYLCVMGRLQQSAAASQEAVRLARACGDLYTLGIALSNVGLCDMQQGDLAQAQTTMVEALEAAERAGALSKAAVTLCALSDLAYIKGDWELASKYAEDALDAVRPVMLAYTSLWPQTTRGRLWLAKGARERGVAALEDALARGEHGGHLQVLQLASEALAELDLLENRAPVARARLEPYHAFIKQLDLNLAWLLPWTYLECGEVERAMEVLDSAIAEARAQRMRLRLADGLRVRAVCHLRQEQWSLCAEALDEALSHAQAVPYPYAEAKALWVYGRLEKARGEPLGAQRWFEEAQAICARLGERLYAERIEHDLTQL